MTADMILNEAVTRLIACGIDEPQANAQWLLSDAMGKSRLDILANLDMPVPDDIYSKFQNYLNLKEQRLPLAYILGKQDFIDITLKVDKRVLIPRPETEELAQYAANFIHNLRKKDTVRIADYGAGSGAIGFWLLTKFENANLLAVEKSAEALKCAEYNAGQLKLSDRVVFKKAEKLTDIEGKFDLIVSNPPYIPTDVIGGLSPEVLNEPHMALDGGNDGLDIAKMLVKYAPQYLNYGGALIMELSGGQPKQLISELKHGVWRKTEIFKDFNTIERFFCAMV